ncbi:MAG: hypothetical protein KF884_08175 [Fimbriimonadaceae bacterium]|nr:hypothetical protein [Fimbriimonadaceae bacterium]QYK57526.1 MAG: hypothetical protein KF884_08175 [Fimbriimonadaceae bacterium]
MACSFLAAIVAGFGLYQEPSQPPVLLFSEGMPRPEALQELKTAYRSKEWGDLLVRYGLKEFTIKGNRCLVQETALGIGQLRAWAKIAPILDLPKGETSATVRSSELEEGDRRSLEMSVANFFNGVVSKPQDRLEPNAVVGSLSLSLALQFESPTRSALLILWPQNKSKGRDFSEKTGAPPRIEPRRLVDTVVQNPGARQFCAEVIGGVVNEVEFHRLVGAVTERLVAEREDAYAAANTALRATIQRFREAYKDQLGEEIKPGLATDLASLDDKLRAQVLLVADQRFASEGFKSAAEMREFLSVASLSRHRYYLTLTVAQPGTKNSFVSIPLSDILVKP